MRVRFRFMFDGGCAVDNGAQSEMHGAVPFLYRARQKIEAKWAARENELGNVT